MESRETKKATLELIDKSEVASLYTILFENDSGYVIDLQNFDSIIKTAQKEGIISVEKTEIIGIENQKFTL